MNKNWVSVFTRMYFATEDNIMIIVLNGKGMLHQSFGETVS